VKIIALVKYSMDVAEIRVDASNHSLKLSGVPQHFGDLDKSTVEAAVRLKGDTDAVVEVLCFGPVAARSGVKDLLAIGADQATIVNDPFDGKVDAAVAVIVLEAALRKLAPFDLVLCGFASDDGYSYQTGPRLAERLKLPLVSYACQLDLDSGTLLAQRDVEDSLESVSTPLPAIVSLAEEAFVPRSVTLLQAMKAQKKPTVSLDLDDLGLNAGTLQAAQTCEALGETGVIVERQQKIIKGDDLSALADQLIDALVARDVLALGCDE